MGEKRVLRRLQILPRSPEPEFPRAPRSAPLKPEELVKHKIVCFVPDVEEYDIASTTSPAPSAQTVSSPLDYTRLPYPPVYLKSHQSTCAICQECFTAPQIGRAILLKAEPLRLLGCGHVFHVSLQDRMF